ncbi:MAG: sulfatase-like hydrolase/transferase [Chthoniobacteraceae bacterium]
MKTPRLIRWFVALAMPLAFFNCFAGDQSAGVAGNGAGARPNIIFILADDLGYGDVGPFFQDLRRAKNDPTQPCELTPQLDAMAAGGITLPMHYSGAPVCAPARGTLLAGVTQGHAAIRDNQFDKALEKNHTLATVLRQAGYATAIVGKWGMQGTKEFPGDENTPLAADGGMNSPAAWPGYPTKRGFDFFYGYVRHADGHEHYPLKQKKQVWENDREVSAGVAKCYTGDLWTARAKKWIVDQHTAHPDQPFFLYLAFDTPHAVTELPTGAYPEGGGLRGGMQWTGQPGAMINTAKGAPDSYYSPQFANATYVGPLFGDRKNNPDAGVSRERPWPDVCKRYATVVQRLDAQVGDVQQLLKDLHIDKNTLVVFTSDNGPSPESYLMEGENHPDFFHSFGPYDGIKRDCWEGGWHMGAIARWPGVIPENRVSQTPSQFQDWMPTMAEVAGVPAPARTDGVSLLPTLTGNGAQIPSTIYTEYFFKGKTPGYEAFAPAHRNRPRNQMQAIRLGDYMGVRYDIKSQDDPFEIYDIPNDPQETHNIAGEKTALEQQMKEAVLGMRRPDASAARPYDDVAVPSVAAAHAAPGIAWSAYEKHFPWVPKLEFLTPDKSGTGAAPDVAQLPRKSDAAMLYSGYISAPADGDYTFYLTADAGALLRIHAATVIDADFGFVPNKEYSAVIRLKAGLHPFRLYYNHNTAGNPVLGLQWSGPGIEKQPVPANDYSHELPGK